MNLNRKERGLSAQQHENGLNYLLENYARFNVEFTNAEGYWLYDSRGGRYLDFLCGIAVTGFGHNHPVIKAAVNDQLNKVWHTSNLFASSLQKTAAEKLCKLSGLDKAFFCNSGTEANEAAIKFARKWGGKRTKIISMESGFHGRTLGSLSATAQPKYWEGFMPLVPGFEFVPYNNIDSLAAVMSPDVAAVFLEPIQGEGGIVVPDNGYLAAVRELCDKYNALLIIDEVQSGLGRTGKVFAYQWEDIKPDIVTVAKGIANGLPLGAVLCSDAVAEGMGPGTHGSTFGGNPVSLAAAVKVLDLLTPAVLADVTNLGGRLKSALLNLECAVIQEVRHKGLMIGIEFNDALPAKELAQALLNDFVVTGTAAKNTLRLLPPYIIDDEAVNIFIDIFGKVIKRKSLELNI